MEYTSARTAGYPADLVKIVLREIAVQFENAARVTERREEADRFPPLLMTTEKI